MNGYANEVMSAKEARRRLNVSQPVFNALQRSRLLGGYFRNGDVLVVGIEHYEFYGTQWMIEGRDDLGDRTLDAEYMETMPLPPDHGDGDQTGVHTRMYIQSDNTPDLEEANATDVGWLAHFYLTPNLFFFPAPTTFAMVGAQLLKLDAPRKVWDAKLPTCLYPDPYGSLGLVTVFGMKQPLEKAYETAYDIVAPVLDELSAKYDQPLPIAHNLVLQIPSGLMTTNYAKIPRTKKLTRDEPVLAACPYPQLRPTLALYREGASSNNPFHQFIALWKAYENACEVKGTWQREHKQRPQKVREEEFPVDAFGYREYAGMTFDEVKQQMERPLRVALAHGSNVRDGKPLTAASADDLMSVTFAVPIIRFMARVTIENVRATLNSSVQPIA